MARIEQAELEAHRNQIIGDVEHLVGKYRKIFNWDVPDIDENAANKMILAEVHKALDQVEKKLVG